MDRLSAMELFVLSIDEGSLSAGARRLGRPPAAATRAVSMLEEETSETLLIRSTRRIALTAAGQHWLDIWRGVLTQLAAGRTGPEPGGKITITAPDLFGRTWVQPIVEEFFRKHSKVNTRLLLLNRAVDLLEEGVDLAIRVGALPDNGVTAARLGQVHNLLCAAPNYVEKRGQPRSPADLRHHDCIGTSDGSDVWQLNDQRLGKLRSYTVPLRFSVNNGGAVLEAVLRGIGIGRVMSCQALPHLDSGHLVSLMPDRATGPIPVHLVFRGHPPRSGTVRDFVDHAVPLIRQRLSEVEAAIAPIVAGRSGARRPSRRAVAG